MKNMTMPSATVPAACSLTGANGINLYRHSDAEEEGCARYPKDFRT